MAFAYTKLADFILDDLYGFASANAMKNSLRYIAEDVLGDPSVNSGQVNATAWTAASANASRAAATRTTGTTVGIGGIAISGSSGTFTTTSGSYVDVTNLSVTITTSGRPVRLFLAAINDAAANGSWVGANKNSASSDNNIGIAIQILRDATILCAFRTEIGFVATTSTEPIIRVPPSVIEYIDAVAAGTYTYKVQARILVATEEAEVRRCQLVAYEL